MPGDGVEVSRLFVKIGGDAREAISEIRKVAAETKAAQGVIGLAGGASNAAFNLIGAGAKAAMLPLNLLGGAFNMLTAPIRLVGDLIGSMAGQMMLGILGAQGLQRAMSMLSDITIGFNARLEQSQMAWTTFLGSAEDAEAWMLRMQKFAALTPFDFEGTERGFRTLRAYGFAVQELVPWLQRLGNASAAVGAGTQGIDRLAMAIGQTRAAGQLRGQEVLQLTQMGVPVSQMMADFLGKSTTQVRAMQEAGEISAQIFEEAFTDWIEQKGDLMGALNKTFLGSLSTIKDTVSYIGATAFKPFFDLLSEGAQSLAEWLQTDEFATWAARINAAASMAVEGLRTLAPVVAGVVGDVLGLLWDLAQGAVDALSYLNPWAEHSPSLVQQVESGVEAILDKYGLLSEIAIPFKAGSDAFKAELASQRTEVDLYRTALDHARDALRQWTQTPIKGEGEAQERIFNLQQKVKQAQLDVVNLQLSNASRGLVERAQKHVQELQQQLQRAQLQADIRFDPQRRQIETAGSTTPAEQPLAAILKGISGARDEIALLTPVYDEHRKVLDAMDKSQREAAASAKALIGAGEGAGGVRLADDKSFLGLDKEQLANWKQQIEGFRSDFENIRDFLVGAAGAGERLRSVLAVIHDEGLVAGISQLLYPTGYGLTAAEQQYNAEMLVANADALEAGKPTQSLIKAHFLEAPTFTEWEPLLTQMWEDFELALDKTWTVIEPGVKERGKKIGLALAEGIKDTTGEIVATLMGWQTGVQKLDPTQYDPMNNPLSPEFQSARRAAQALGRQTGVQRAEPSQYEAATDPFVMPGQKIEAFVWQKVDDAIAVITQALGWHEDNGSVSRIGEYTPANDPFSPDAMGKKAKDTIDGWTKSLADWLNNPVSLDEIRAAAQQSGSAVGEGMQGGLKEQERGLERASKDLIKGGVMDPITNTLGIRSPSKLAEEWGESVALGLVAGMEGRTIRTWMAVKDWITDTVGSALDDMVAPMQRKAKTLGQSVASGLQSGLSMPGGTVLFGDMEGRARGGWVTAGQSVIVGEERPEVFTPGTSGYVHPSTQGGGASLTIGEIHVHNEADEDRLVRKIWSVLTGDRETVISQGVAS